MAEVTSIATLVMVGLLGIERIMNRLGFRHCHSECMGSSLDISNNSGTSELEAAVTEKIRKMSSDLTAIGENALNNQK